MAYIEHFVGLPTYDWEALFGEVILTGTIASDAIDATQITLQSGTITLEINGIGLDVSGGAITGGTVLEVRLVDNGVDVLEIGEADVLEITGPELEALRTAPDLTAALADLLGTTNFFVGGSNDDDVLRGAEGSNSLDGREGNDELHGYGGDNFYEGGEGTDAYFGSMAVGDDHWDKISYENETGGTGIAAQFLGGEDVVIVDTYGNVEFGSGINEVKGSAYGDNILGSSDHDQAEGMGGDDFISLGGDRDKVEYVHEEDAGGISGVIVNLSGSAIIGTVTDGTFTVAAGTARDSFGDTDTLIDVEDIDGTRFVDVLVGSDEDNNLRGDAGVGGGGADTVHGLGGDDRVSMGDGGGFADGGSGFDTVQGLDDLNAYLILNIAGETRLVDRHADSTSYVNFEEFEFDNWQVTGAVTPGLNGINSSDIGGSSYGWHKDGGWGWGWHEEAGWDTGWYSDVSGWHFGLYAHTGWEFGWFGTGTWDYGWFYDYGGLGWGGTTTGWERYGWSGGAWGQEGWGWQPANPSWYYGRTIDNNQSSWNYGWHQTGSWNYGWHEEAGWDYGWYQSAGGWDYGWVYFQGWENGWFQSGDGSFGWYIDYGGSGYGWTYGSNTGSWNGHEYSSWTAWNYGATIDLGGTDYGWYQTGSWTVGWHEEAGWDSGWYQDSYGWASGWYFSVGWEYGWYSTGAWAHGWYTDYGGSGAGWHIGWDYYV